MGELRGQRTRGSLVVVARLVGVEREHALSQSIESIECLATESEWTGLGHVRAHESFHDMPRSVRIGFGGRLFPKREDPAALVRCVKLSRTEDALQVELQGAPCVQTRFRAGGVR